MGRVHVEEVVKDLYIIRIDDFETKYFESLWSIPEGVTYNAYVAVGAEGAVLFDGCRGVFTDLFVDALRRIVDLKDVKYVVVHHTEPDHTGSLPKVLSGCGATVLGHPMAAQLIRSFYGLSNLRFVPVSDGEEKIIAGVRVRFFWTPWLHWPDTIMSFLPDTAVLLSCDALGGFSVPETLFDDDEGVVSKYMPYVRKYVTLVVGHYRKHIRSGIEKLVKAAIEPKVVAPGHGLVWRRNPKRIIDYYLKLSDGVPEKGKVTVVYASMYGAVEAAVKVLEEELRRHGATVVSYGFTSTEKPDPSDILSDIADSEALVIAAATYETEIFPEIKHVLDLITQKAAYNRPAIVISSYGWGGIAAKKISEKLSSAGYKVIDTIEFKGAPTKDVKERVVEAARKLIEHIQRQ